MWALLNVNQVRTQVFLHLKIANGHKVTATSKKKKGDPATIPPRGCW